MTTYGTTIPHDWRPISQSPEALFVMTKVHDVNGCRMEQIMRRQGNLWFGRDGCYVYYAPTHFRYLSISEKLEIVNQRKAVAAAAESRIFEYLG